MGGCCGAMKTGQKSLPDKKKSSSDVAAVEKSNGKEAVPATDAGKTPTPDAAEVQQQQSVKGGADEPATGSVNVMDLETAVAPYEGIVSTTDQPQVQASVAVAADPETLLPYQIPVQHTFSSTTTTTTTTTVRPEDVQLRIDEPHLDVDFQDGGVLSALARDLVPSSTGDVQVETVTKVTTETVTTEAIPAVPELGAGGAVEFGSTGESGETAEEPIAVLERSSFQEVQRLPEEFEESRAVAEVSLPEPCYEKQEPIIMVCPGRDPSPEPPIPDLDSHFIAVCPPADPDVVFSGFDHQLSPDPGSAVISESVFQGEQVPHGELAIGEPSGLVRDFETVEIQQQQVVADLESAPEFTTESPSVPVQDIQVDASLELPEQTVGESSSVPELHGQLETEFATTSPEQPQDFPPPLQQDQAAEPPGVEVEAGVTGSSQLAQDLASEPAPYILTEESHQEFGQEPYQEHQHSEEAAPYQAASGVESVDAQDPVSVSDDVIQTVEAAPIIESVSEEAHESRNTWWKEGGGQPEAEGGDEIPVVETVSDQAQESRQSWWEQSGSEPPTAVQELPVEPLSHQPDDLSSIPPPPAASEEEGEHAATTTTTTTTPSIPAEIDAVSPSSDSFPEVIPEPLPSTFDQGASGGGGGTGATVESPLSSSVDGSTLPTENGEVSVSSDEAFTPASVLSPEGSTPASNLSPDGVEPAAAAAAASSKEPISAQA